MKWKIEKNISQELKRIGTKRPGRDCVSMDKGKASTGLAWVPCSGTNLGEGLGAAQTSVASDKGKWIPAAKEFVPSEAPLSYRNRLSDQ